MPARGTVNQRLAKVTAAFNQDCYDVTRHEVKDDALGILAEHRTAKNQATGKPKKAFYVDGNPRQSGYLIGVLAKEDVCRMATEFVDHFIFDFIGMLEAGEEGIGRLIQERLVHIIRVQTQSMIPDIPTEYMEEIDGLVEGAGMREVNRENLVALNFGVDCALAHLYSGTWFEENNVKPRMLRIPSACNTFFLTEKAAGSRHFFGRDYMFPTAGVFQDTACITVYNPESPRRAHVSQGAPGLIGSMVAMNTDGVAVGVDVLAGRMCNAERPGFNSLALNRHVAQYSGSADEAVGHIADAQRGVCWLYPVADARGKAYAVEAGCKIGPDQPFPYLEYVPRYLKRLLPKPPFIERMRRLYRTPEPDRGIIARPIDYRYPVKYLKWNRRLWKAWNRNWLQRILDFFMAVVTGKNSWKEFVAEVGVLFRDLTYSREYFTEKGYINQKRDEHNCPGPFFFAPQRESRADTMLVCNTCITPEMRLTAMNSWVATISNNMQNDFQWRYDELNREILDAVAASPGGVEEPVAWNLINFLRPDGSFPDYYPRDAQGRILVHGSVTLCELGSRSMKSLFGYYGDEPVSIKLMNYV
ncbi:MAG TPA: carcinine hydrolase/isopenicillin-N N-acyltransferase family protein [Spirochaetia bacterium]|nr:carcinine hydrolase/isopenicillin-N N-acyltransferase family protein [Spirochaetia bacterium]